MNYYESSNLQDMLFPSSNPQGCMIILFRRSMLTITKMIHYNFKSTQWNQQNLNHKSLFSDTGYHFTIHFALIADLLGLNAGGAGNALGLQIIGGPKVTILASKTSRKYSILLLCIMVYSYSDSDSEVVII